MPGFELSGKIVEHELFGTPERLRDGPDYLPFPVAMKTLRKLQPGDPKDPKPLFAYHVLVDAEELLGIAGEDKLSFFTAVDSILDYKHGVDGWFELDNGVRAEVDLTTNPEKDQAKAEILFHVPPGGYANEAEIKEGAARLAEEIARKLGASIDSKRAS